MPCNSEACLLQFDVRGQCFHNMFAKMQKFNTTPLWNGFIYLWTLLHGVTGSKNNKYAWHFETEISGSMNQEISWPNKEFPIDGKILTAMLVKREVSNMSYPRRYGSSTVNSSSKKPPHKTSPSLWHHLPLPAPTPTHVGAVGWVGYINLANQANRKWQLRAKVKVKFMLQPATKEQRSSSSNLPITSPLDGGGHFSFQNDPVPISNCELSDKVKTYRIH